VFIGCAENPSLSAITFLILYLQVGDTYTDTSNGFKNSEITVESVVPGSSHRRTRCQQCGGGLDAGKYFWRSGREKCFSLDIPFYRTFPPPRRLREINPKPDISLATKSGRFNLLTTCETICNADENISVMDCCRNIAH
jgi:hypothetical protein